MLYSGSGVMPEKEKSVFQWVQAQCSPRRFVQAQFENGSVFILLGLGLCSDFILKLYQDENPLFLPIYFHHRNLSFWAAVEKYAVVRLRPCRPACVSAHITEQIKQGLPLPSIQKGNSPAE